METSELKISLYTVGVARIISFTSYIESQAESKQLRSAQ